MSRVLRVFSDAQTDRQTDRPTDRQSGLKSRVHATRNVGRKNSMPILTSFTVAMSALMKQNWRTESMAILIPLNMAMSSLI